MLMDESVLCLAFSWDSELLATGSTDGAVKVWRIQFGQCVRKLDKAHLKAVTTLIFTKDRLHLLSGSFDHNLR